MTTKCPNGHDCDDNARFCPICGAALPSPRGSGAPPSPADQAQISSADAAVGSDKKDSAGPSGTDDQPAPPGGSSRSPVRRRVIILVAVMTIIGLVVVALLLQGGDDKHTVAGTIRLFDTDGVDGEADACAGSGGYQDIAPGMDVTVRDADGRIIGSGATRNMTRAELGSYLVTEGEAADRDEADELVDETEGFVCFLLFEIDVENAEFYEFTLGRRGELSESRKELEENDWRVSYSIGE